MLFLLFFFCLLFHCWPQIGQIELAKVELNILKLAKWDWPWQKLAKVELSPGQSRN